VSHLRCLKCDEVVLRFADSRRLQEDAIAIYRKKHGLLSADEIRAIRERFGLTRPLSSLLGRFRAKTALTDLQDANSGFQGRARNPETLSCP
jgi:hypothetical protein